MMIEVTAGTMVARPRRVTKVRGNFRERMVKFRIDGRCVTDP
jgi:hypothetical protein